jgi:hypothetical protein
LVLKTPSQKIPIRINWTEDAAGVVKTQIVMNSNDFFASSTEISASIEEFKKRYFDLVKKARKILPQKKAVYKNKNSKKRSKKRRKNEKASVYWKVGNLFRKFNENIEHEFEITNYNAALEHDFGLSNRYVQELIIFASLFNEKEIDDSISISVYRALVWKKNQLVEIGGLEKEKSRLLQRIKNKENITRESYKKELQLLVNSGVEGSK